MSLELWVFDDGVVWIFFWGLYSWHVCGHGVGNLCDHRD